MSSYLAGIDAMYALQRKPREAQDIVVTPVQPFGFMRARPTTVVGDVGIDINAANKAIRGVKPMSIAAGHKLVAIGISGLNAANSADSDHPGATSRRNDLIRQLNNINATLSSTTMDPLPEAAAEVLRNAVLAAIAEYNSAAEGSATLAAARSQFFQDVVDNAKQMAIKAGAVIKDVADEAAFYTKVTFWVGVGLVGLVGYTGYRILTGPAGQRLVPWGR